MRPPVIDGIEEHDPTGRIEERNFLESDPPRPRTSPVEAPRFRRSITPARRLDAAPAELRASSTRQTTAARPSTAPDTSTSSTASRSSETSRPDDRSERKLCLP